MIINVCASNVSSSVAACTLQLMGFAIPFSIFLFFLQFSPSFGPFLALEKFFNIELCLQMQIEHRIGVL